MKLVCWHPVLTDHQSHTLEALKNAGVSEMRIFVLKMDHADRHAQGWVNRHADGLRPSLLPQRGRFVYMLKKLLAHGDATHIFGRPFEQPILILALLMAVLLHRRVFLISEPYSPITAGYQNDGQPWLARFKSLLRPALYKLYGGLLRRRLAGIFAISPLAVAQYTAIGISPAKIFPFAYFIPRVVGEKRRFVKTGDPHLRVIFIGTLIRRKGLDILIDAIEGLRRKGVPVSLDVYGPGDPDRFKFDDSGVRYRGKIPFGETQPVIADYDVLALPSRYDGWGVVVNEALMAGVPVICSDRVGAGAVIAKWQCGAIFSSEDTMDLAMQLQRFIDEPELLDRCGQAAIAAAGLLLPEVAGSYMFNVVSQSNFLSAANGCPWYD